MFSASHLDVNTPPPDKLLDVDADPGFSKLRITWDYPTPGLVLDLGSFF